MRVPESWAKGDWEQRFMWESMSFIPLAGIGFAVPGFFVSFAYHDPVYVLAALSGGLVACVELRLRRARMPGAKVQQAAVAPRRRMMRSAAFQPPRHARHRLPAAAPPPLADSPGSTTTT